MGRPNRNRLSVDRTIRDEYGRIGNQIGGLQDRIASRYPEADRRAEELRGQIGGFANQALGANYDPNDFESYGIMRGFTGAGGGIDPRRTGSIDENIAGYKDIARTGGWSDADKSNARLRASRTPTAFYTNLKNDMERRRNATGGYAPGFGTADARATRESARAAADATLDADIGISESVREGQLAGLSGATAAEMGLINAIEGNRRFGASGMQQGEGMALDATQRERMAGLGALENLYSAGAGGEFGQLLDAELSALGLRGSQVQGLIGQQGAEDSRRWDRKGRVANTAAGGLATAASGGPGGSSPFSKPRMSTPYGPGINS